MEIKHVAASYVGLKAELNMSINAIMEKNGFESCCSDERKL